MSFPSKPKLSKTENRWWNLVFSIHGKQMMAVSGRVRWVSEIRPHVPALAYSSCLRLPEIPILGYTMSSRKQSTPSPVTGFQGLSASARGVCLWVPKSAFSLRLTPGLSCTGCNSWKASWFHESCLLGWEMRKKKKGKWDKNPTYVSYGKNSALKTKNGVINNVVEYFTEML